MRRDGNDLKQIARVLNAGGEPPEWLAHAIEPTNGVVDRIDMTVADLTRPDSSKAYDALGVRGRRLGCSGESDVCHQDLVIGGTRGARLCWGVLTP